MKNLHSSEKNIKLQIKDINSKIKTIRGERNNSNSSIDDINNNEQLIETNKTESYETRSNNDIKTYKNVYNNDYSNYNENNRENNHNIVEKLITMLFGSIHIIFIAGFGILFLSSIISSFVPKNQYLKDIKVVEGVIISKETDDNNDEYIKVRLNNYTDGVYFTNDNSYVKVTWVFYSNKAVGDTVGILASNYDTFAPKYWGMFGNKKQYLQKSEWYIDGIYNSLYEAKQVNPVKIYKQKVTLIKKKELKTGEKFFVMKVDDRTIKEKVDIVTFEKHKENDTLECYFESTGDFSKFLRIIE